MARSDGHGARSGHHTQRRPGHQLEQPDAPHYGTDTAHAPAGWPDSRGLDPQYSHEQYWQHPSAPQGYDPAGPAFPVSSHGGLGHPVEPMAPDPAYASEPQRDSYSNELDPYHYPQEPSFDPAPPPHLPPAYPAPEFPPFHEATGGYAQVSGYGQSGDYAAQHDPLYPSTSDPQLHSYQPPHPPQQVGGQFQDYIDQNSLRGPDFEDWPRPGAAPNDGQAGYNPSSPFGPAAAQHGGYAEPGWQQQDGSYPLDSSSIFANAGYDAPQELALHSGYEDDEYDEAEDEPVGPSRGARIGWILMALAGFVVIGGTLAYGYKILLGPSATQVAGTPVVKSSSEPPKVRPQDPGGRSFDHTDSKILGRLSEQRNAASSEPLADDGSRRVSTVVVGRNGDIVAPQTAPTPSATPPANPVVTVPGLTLVDGFGGRGPSAPAAVPQQPIVVQPPASSEGAPAKPVVISRSEPETSDNEAAPPPPSKPAEPPERVTEQRTAAVAPAKANPPVTTASTTPPAAESAGYVAVLASVPVSATSRVDALAQYADIQQSYSSVLGSRTPDVREANLGSRGRYHRLMVGPPGSKESAADLCAQLKAAGYSGCWITTY